MKLARLAAATTLSLLSACTVSKDRAVYAYLPINRLESPEPGARAFDGSIGVGGIARLRLTDDQTRHSPTESPPQAQLRGVGLAKVEATPLPFFAAALKVYNGVPAAQFKLMPLAGLTGRSPYSLAATFAYGKYDDQYDYDSTSSSEPYAYTTMNQKLHDYAVVAGLRTSPKVLLFGGPYRSYLRYGGTYRSTSTPLTTYDQRSIATGGNVGIAWTPIRWIRVLGEVSAAAVRTGSARENVISPALSAEFFFGPLQRHAAPADREEPVKVVPVEETPARR